MSSEKAATPNTNPSTSETNTADISNTTDVSNEQGTSTTVSANAGSMEVAERKSADEYIKLRVITSDMTNEVHFRVKPSTSLGRLKRSYCSKLGLQSGELRFVFEGNRITDNDTPESLGLINLDVIEVYQERTGGM